MSFEALGLRDELRQAISEMGFEAPLPIQRQAIPLLLAADTDFIGLAQTGTGKTAAYGLPLLQKLDPAVRAPQGLILCPTRELCVQITQELRQFGRHLKGFRAVAVYGGASISYQVQELRRGAQAVVATPGRLMDLMQRGAVDLARIARVVLDEADVMLDMGFQEDIDVILKALPASANTWLFSATMNRAVGAVARRVLKDPVEVTVGSPNQGADNIAHVCYTVHPSHRYASLKRLIDMTPELFALIFRRTRKDAQELAENLVRDGYAAESLHGDLSQAQRDSVMGRFRRQQVRLLVATDVAARGIDVDDITHIIHYDLPDDLEVYTHRSGRTARAGKSGASIVFVSPAERERLGHLERRLRLRFTHERVPDGLAIRRRQMRSLAERLAATELDEAEVSALLPEVESVLAPLDREALVKRLVALELQRVQGAHVSSQDLNAAAPSAGGPRPPRAPRESGPMQRFEINFGTVDGIREGAIVRLICERAGVTSSHIGSIRLQEETSFFEVNREVAGQVIEGLREALLDGRPVRIREAIRRPYPGHGRFTSRPHTPERPPRPYRKFRVHSHHPRADGW